MKTSEFDYNLDDSLIATEPANPRDSARLLVLDREDGNIQDRVFRDLCDLLDENDILVLNNSKVIPARIFGNVLGNVRNHEVLLVKQRKGSTWECWIRNGKKLSPGETLMFSNRLSAKYLGREDDIFILDFSLAEDKFFAALLEIGEMPIPPYILKARHASHDEDTDNTEYQTVYAKSEGSVAAPTAGLHFTQELLTKIREKGVGIEFVTLHVGLGTFQPLNTDNIEDFHIHSEFYEIDPDTAQRLNEAKSAGKRIIAVGTTTVRVLESAAAKVDSCGMTGCGKDYLLLPKAGDTNIFIYPGYSYKYIDAMITNFHLPKSSLLLLVSALAGKENIDKAYKHAIENKYRFYSYGDAMFIK